ncbi:uncharacterized protein LOC111906496 isoform X7 [Lactuca sativa]|uniref:uncharacterized protein LOC111906496 isoform X7 n=1 Tax=Lactuca sativa TaxID=4236 RepID=UPI001C691647|nr:uncharacterized protein LOC111906496 isoform X7 [Lactuca sativa]
MRTGTNNSLFRTGLLLYVSTRGLSPQQAQAHENSKAFTLVTLHTNRTASNSSRKIRRWCSPQQKFTTQDPNIRFYTKHKHITIRVGNYNGQTKLSI